MHFLSENNRSEFLATPQLVRFEYSQGLRDYEPTLLIKGSTILLKYIVQGVPMRLVFARVRDRLLYGLKVYDDGETGGLLWSLLERDAEKNALTALVRGDTCQLFLFNELAVNVAEAALQVSIDPSLTAILAQVTTGEVDHSEFKNEISTVHDQLENDDASRDDLIVAELPSSTTWHPVHSHFITSRATSSLIDLFNEDEGGQQEQLAIWLTDNLLPLGVHHSPQIPKGKGFRELTDILISYPFGSFLVESKTLAVLARDKLPSRRKLAHDVSAHIKKAVDQLQGGIRQLKKGTQVLSKPSGIPLEIERTHPMHAIVLIPDLELIEDPKTYDISFLRNFMEATGGFLHLLDISELLRIVQAAEMIAARGKTTTPMMAFDYYLQQRIEKAVQAGTLCIEVLLRIKKDE